MTLMQRIEEVRMIQQQERDSKCDFCGKNHTDAEIREKELAQFYNDAGILFAYGVIGQDLNKSLFFPEDDELVN